MCVVLRDNLGSFQFSAIFFFFNLYNLDRLMELDRSYQDTIWRSGQVTKD